MNGLYYDGATWTAPLLQGRTLAATSALGPNRYGSQDPSQPTAAGPGFWSNPYAWAVQGIADQYRDILGDAYWGRASNAETYGIMAGSVFVAAAGIVYAPGAAAAIGVKGAVGTAVVGGALEAGGTYLVTQSVAQVGDAWHGQDLARFSFSQFATTTAFGALGGGASVLGGRALASALRPVATEVRYAMSGLARGTGEFLAARPELNPLNYRIIADKRGVMLGSGLSTNLKFQYVTPRDLPKGFDITRGHATFDDFKKVFGEAGSSRAWHHIVEQTINSERFSPYLLHNPGNLVNLPHGKGLIHTQISGYYSSKIPGLTGNSTVREWLSTKSFIEQFEFGIDIIRQFEGSQYLPKAIR